MTEREDRVGQQLGSYRLVRLLGKGGFAEVYLAEHTNRKSMAAVKVLHTRLAKDNFKDFLNEARSFRLKHPHIIPIIDFGMEDDFPYLVMEYAPNGSLRQRHPKGSRLPLGTIAAYTKQLADALQYAHDDKLIHRDIKPENMLVGRSNEILLSDFGIATMAQSSRYQNQQDMAGTITYMAPEQIQGKPRPASDQYSLGIVVYEWLTGKRPFHGSLTELIGQHISTPPQPIRNLMPKLSPAVEEVVMRSLAKDPKERFARIIDFSIALEKASQVAQFQQQVQPPLPAIKSTPPYQNEPLQTKVIAAEGSIASPVAASQVFPAQQTKEQVFSAALAHLESGRYTEALAALERVLTLDPTSGYAHNCRGLTLYHLKRYSEALASLNNAIAQNANDTTAYYGKGLTLERMQRYTDALQAFERVTQLQSNYVAAWRKKGDVLFQLKRYEESVAAYEQALKLDANDGDAYIGKGNALKQLGRLR